MASLGQKRKAGKQELNDAECADAVGMTFLLCEINNEGDYRHLDGDTQMRQNPGRLLEG